MKTWLISLSVAGGLPLAFYLYHEHTRSEYESKHQTMTKILAEAWSAGQRGDIEGELFTVDWPYNKATEVLTLLGIDDPADW